MERSAETPTDQHLDPAILRRLEQHFVRRLRAIHRMVCGRGGISERFARPGAIRKRLDDSLAIELLTVPVEGVGHLVVGYHGYVEEGRWSPCLDLTSEPMRDASRANPGGWRAGPHPVDARVYRGLNGALLRAYDFAPLERLWAAPDDENVALVIEGRLEPPRDATAWERLVLQLSLLHRRAELDAAEALCTDAHRPLLADARPAAARWGTTDARLSFAVRDDFALPKDQLAPLGLPIHRWCELLPSLLKGGLSPARITWTRGEPASATTDLAVPCDDARKGWRLGTRYVATFEGDAAPLIAVMTRSATIFERSTAERWGLARMEPSPWLLRGLRYDRYLAPNDRENRLLRWQLLGDLLELDAPARFALLLETCEDDLPLLVRSHPLRPVLRNLILERAHGPLHLGRLDGDQLTTTRIERIRGRAGYRMVPEL